MTLILVAARARSKSAENATLLEEHGIDFISFVSGFFVQVMFRINKNNIIYKIQRLKLKIESNTLLSLCSECEPRSSGALHSQLWQYEVREICEYGVKFMSI